MFIQFPFIQEMITHKYPLYRPYIGISHRGTLVGVHPTIPWFICCGFVTLRSLGFPRCFTIIVTCPVCVLHQSRWPWSAGHWVLLTFGDVGDDFGWVLVIFDDFGWYVGDFWWFFRWIWGLTEVGFVENQKQELWTKFLLFVDVLLRMLWWMLFKFFLEWVSRN